MTFGVGFGPQFGPRPNNIETALRQILPGTDIPEQDRLIRAWVDAAPNSPKREQAILKEHLGTTLWSWPWFDKWLNRFDAAGEWPYMWRRIGRDPNNSRIVLSERLVILAHMLAARCHVLRMVEDHRDALRVIGGRCAFKLDGGGDGALADALEKKVARALMRGDMTTLPPLFPGHRAGLLPVILGTDGKPIP